MTSEERMLALAKANEIRLGRSGVKRAVYRGEMGIAEALEHPYCQSMCVGQLLDAQRRWGRARVLAALSSLLISESKQVQDLTVRQRVLVVSVCSGEREAA